MGNSQSELRLGTLMDARELVHGKHEAKLAELDGKDASHDDKELLRNYREQLEDYDKEIAETAETVERNNHAAEQSKKIRRALAGAGGVEEDGDGVVYRTMASYARDVIITGNGREASKIKGILGDKAELERAESRLQLLKRTPANTLSSDVAGLIPQQHIAEIFQVIQTSRPLVASAQQTDLVRGVDQLPAGRHPPGRGGAVVAEDRGRQPGHGRRRCRPQPPRRISAAATCPGRRSTGRRRTPSTCGSGLAASDYALKTEQDAAQVLQHSAFSYNIASTLAATPTFAQFMTAIGAGYAEVFANCGRIADTIYMAPDRFGYLLGLTCDAFTQFTSVSASPASGRSQS